MAFVHAMISNIGSMGVSLLSIAAIMWGLERLFPKERVSVESQLRSLLFTLFFGFSAAVATTIFEQVSPWLPRPLLIIPLNRWLAHPLLHWSIYLIAPLLGMILYDFFGYWLHRAQHKWCWRIHAVHHSIEELSGINSYSHWLDPFFRLSFISLPAAYVFGIDAIDSVFVVELLVKIQGYYLHTPTDLHLGPVLRRVIADNRFHRIHHSIEPRHYNCNFAAGTTVWDQLFGTAYFPAKDEWPQTGLIGEPSAKTIDEYLWGPFRRPRNTIAIGKVPAPQLNHGYLAPKN